MFKKIIATCICVMFLAAGTMAFAEDVYVTKRGKKYHKETCSLIKNKNARAISKEEALEKGLKPCRRCFKEDIASDVVDEKSKISAEKKKDGKLSKANKGTRSSTTR